jgi:putative transposase
MTTPIRARYAGYRFPAEIIPHGVWLYFRFQLGLRMVEELLAARGIIVSHETVRQWARKFGQRPRLSFSSARSSIAGPRAGAEQDTGT